MSIADLDEQWLRTYRHALLPKTTSSPCMYYRSMTARQLENGLPGDICNFLSLEYPYHGLQGFSCRFNKGSLFPRSLQTVPPVLVTFVALLPSDVDIQRQIPQYCHQFLLHFVGAISLRPNTLHFRVTQ